MRERKARRILAWWNIRLSKEIKRQPPPNKNPLPADRRGSGLVSGSEAPEPWGCKGMANSRVPDCGPPKGSAFPPPKTQRVLVICGPCRHQ